MEVKKAVLDEILTEMEIGERARGEVSRNVARRTVFFETPFSAKRKPKTKQRHVPRVGLSRGPLVYSEMLFLNELWTKYTETIPLSGVEAALRRTDFHGAVLTVMRSMCPTLVDVRGIVVAESVNMFVLLTEDDLTKRVPKKANWFCVVVGGQEHVLSGGDFRQRTAQRIAKGRKRG
ncbi:MAG: ribonuclease P protein subunit p29 [Amphiamblys sp. WSBS2006]|nr:MAG: ribonuclease P protein subunit p29 [Amphiamblys sp. WSBS2006]